MFVEHIKRSFNSLAVNFSGQYIYSLKEHVIPIEFKVFSIYMIMHIVLIFWSANCGDNFMQDKLSF